MTKVFFLVKFTCTTQKNNPIKLNFLPEFEPLVLTSDSSVINFFKTKTDYYYNLNVATTQLFNTILMQQTMLNRLPFLVDAYTIDKPTHNIFYVYNCFYSNRFTNFFFKNTKQSFLSITSFCKSAGWVERELKEFSKLYIIGLTDSRRLLTDYVSEKAKTTPLYYDLISQEIF